MIPKTPAEFEYLIRKTVTYLEFHNDDAAKELAAQWQQVLQQLAKLKKQKAKKRSRSLDGTTASDSGSDRDPI